MLEAESYNSSLLEHEIPKMLYLPWNVNCPGAVSVTNFTQGCLLKPKFRKVICLLLFRFVYEFLCGELWKFIFQMNVNCLNNVPDCWFSILNKAACWRLAYLFGLQSTGSLWGKAARVLPWPAKKRGRDETTVCAESEGERSNIERSRATGNACLSWVCLLNFGTVRFLAKSQLVDIYDFLIFWGQQCLKSKADWLQRLIGLADWLDTSKQ